MRLVLGHRVELDPAITTQLQDSLIGSKTIAHLSNSSVLKRQGDGERWKLNDANSP